MNRESILEYGVRQSGRYQKATKKEKGKILDEVVRVTGYHRKSAVRLLSGRRRVRRGGPNGRPVVYGPKVAAAARVVHEAAGGIGAKRLQPFVCELAGRLEEFGELLDLVENKAAKIIVTAIGGQGHIFGRGNQQLSAEIIGKVGKENLAVVASRQKLVSLAGRPLMVDTGDPELDRALSGYIKVTTGPREYAMYRVGM